MDSSKRKAVDLVKDGPKYKQFGYGRFTVDLFLPTRETWGIERVYDSDGQCGV